MNEVNATICNIKVGDREPTRIMGVINLSPESFYSKSVAKTTLVKLDVALYPVVF